MLIKRVFGTKDQVRWPERLELVQASPQVKIDETYAKL